MKTYCLGVVDVIMTVVWLSLLHYYTAVSGFAAYLFIAIRKIRISRLDFWFLFGLTFLVALHFIIKTPTHIILDFRFYWGWVIFYFIFKAKSVNRETLSAALVILSVLTLVEAALINTVITADMLPNYPDDATVHGLSHIGAYQRPYSFAGSAQVGSSLIVVLMAFCNVWGWRFWLSLLAVLSCVSGTGVFTLVLLLLVRYRVRMIKTVFPLFFILMLGFLLFSREVLLICDMFYDKISLDYLLLLRDLLWLRTLDTFGQAETYMMFIGFPSGYGDGIFGHGGDWGILSFILINGFFGLFLLLLMILFRVNRANVLPLFIILTASIHYSAISVLPGQMLFGLLLSANKYGLSDCTK